LPACVVVEEKAHHCLIPHEFENRFSPVCFGRGAVGRNQIHIKKF